MRAPHSEYVAQALADPERRKRLLRALRTEASWDTEDIETLKESVNVALEKIEDMKTQAANADREEVLPRNR